MKLATTGFDLFMLKPQLSSFGHLHVSQKLTKQDEWCAKLLANATKLGWQPATVKCMGATANCYC